MNDDMLIANDSLTPIDDKRELAEIDHDEWAVPDAIIERLDHLEERLRGIESRQSEFTDLAKKIWGFVEQMKDNPMLSAMLGGLPRK